MAESEDASWTIGEGWGSRSVDVVNLKPCAVVQDASESLSDEWPLFDFTGILKRTSHTMSSIRQESTSGERYFRV
jgi:hypothetical protein